jgi:hypothetical protein
MNAKEVLNKIATALSLIKEEVAFTAAQTADGTILESPTFDLGETVDVVSEDGTKTPAPNGEHEVVLKDSEGNDVRIRVQTQDGKIVERSNVEEETPAKDEAVDMASLAGDDIASPVTPDATSQTPQEIPQTMEALSARIDELEKKFMDMVSEKETTEPKKAEQVEVGENSSQMSAVNMASVDDEEELPKLDGAPVDDEPKPLNKFGKKISTPQSTFLAKLYNK